MDHKNFSDPVTEADLHALVDQQLDPARQAVVASFLAANPEQAGLVADWRAQNEMLRAHLDAALDEPAPARFSARAAPGRHPWRAAAALAAVAVASASSAWVVRGEVAGRELMLAQANATGRQPPGAHLAGFAHRAAVAHAVYSPDARRPVEVGADEERQLVTWLSKRLGTPLRVPSLGGVGYVLLGGRLLPGERGPVAQFMYHDPAGRRLTLYVTRELARKPAQRETAFRVGVEGPVSVFYWVDGDFGYAVSGGIDRTALLRVAQEIYRQLDRT